MSIRLFSNAGKLFSTSVTPETENKDPVKDIKEKKRKLQELKRRAAAKFKPIPSEILSLISRLGNMLQLAGLSASVTEAKVNQLLSQISAMIGSTQETKPAGKDNGMITLQGGKDINAGEAKKMSENVSLALKKNSAHSLLNTAPGLKVL